MTRRSRFHPALFSLALLALVPTAALSQTVQIRPTAEHPDPHQIFLDQTKMDIRIESGVAHVTLDQVFANPNKWVAEGTYLFPLPEGTAVTEFELYMDDKPVKGEVLGRKEARDIYLGIVRRLRDPALLEYADNRLFRARVFPFEPMKTRRITLKYAQILQVEGDFRVFRYQPGVSLNSTVSGWGGLRDASGGVPSAANERHASGFVVSGSVRDPAGVGSVYSPTHVLDTDAKEDGSVEFAAEGRFAAVKGFDVYIESAARWEGPAEMSFLTHRPEGENGYWMLTISPGQDTDASRGARDLILVLDVSGSMQGEKLEQAVAALDSGLARLGPEDRFGIITFSTQARLWTKGLEPATRQSIQRARRDVATFGASGSTNLEDALRMASGILGRDAEEGGATDTADRTSYLVLLTDGLPNNGLSDPDQLIELISSGNLAGTRAFTWGVGWDVNTYLLDKLARETRGLAEYVRPDQRIEELVGRFLARISFPTAVDLTFDLDPAVFYDFYPSQLPDLFRGEVLTVLGRFSGSGPQEFRLRGKTSEGPFEVSRSVTLPEKKDRVEFLPPLWAQRKVGYLMEQVRLTSMSEEARDEITALGTRHGIVTPFTSYLVTEPVVTDASRSAGVRRGAAPAVTLPAGRGTIRGVVRDAQTGDPLAAVNISVLTSQDEPTQVGAMTNAQGEYVIINVPSGQYNLLATMMGFRETLYEDQQVVDGATSVRDFSLEQTVLQIGETVSVAAERKMIQRDVTGIQQRYTIEEMERMAVSTATDILTLQTNTYQMEDMSRVLREYRERRLGQVHMRGGRNAEVAFMMEGGNVTNEIFRSMDQSGRIAVLQSMAEKALQRSETTLATEGMLKRIGEREFRFDLDRATWQDSALPTHPDSSGQAAWDAGFEEIETTSEAFLMLIEEEPDLLKAAALGRKVEVKVGEKRIRLLTPVR